jgi:hypothetical protein
MDLLSVSTILVPKNNFRSSNNGDICQWWKNTTVKILLKKRDALGHQLYHFVVDILSYDDLKRYQL